MPVKDAAKVICKQIIALHPSIYGVKILDDEASEVHAQYADQPDKASLAKIWENEKLVIVWGLISSFDRMKEGLKFFQFAGEDSSVLCIPAMDNLIIVVMSPKIPLATIDEILSIIQTEA
ncbi:MAG: hypothetical protein HYY22_03525 [Thaumarchaeota archaeon]|nr:hypothetical protein [Nitrososphaerota archaeon]